MPEYKDILNVLKDVGFYEYGIFEGIGYYYDYYSSNIELYLNRGLIKISPTENLIYSEIYKPLEISYYYETIDYAASKKTPLWRATKWMIFNRKDLTGFRDFLLLSICRDSFLSPEEEVEMNTDIFDRDESPKIERIKPDWFF